MTPFALILWAIAISAAILVAGVAVSVVIVMVRSATTTTIGQKNPAP